MTSITARMLESCGNMLDLDVRERPHYRSLQSRFTGQDTTTAVSATSMAAIAQCIALCARDAEQSSFNILMGDLAFLRLDRLDEQQIIVVY